MAYFDTEELIDIIRHDFMAEDDTGICSRVLSKPRRRPRAGGIPLNFRHNEDEQSESGSDSPRYMAVLGGVSTTELMEQRIRSRTVDSEKSVTSSSPSKAKLVIAGQSNESEPCTDSDCFRYRDPHSVSRPMTSMTSRLLQQRWFIVSPSLAAYSRFESLDPAVGRELKVFFPFAGSSDADPRIPYFLQIRVIPQTRVCDTIGLCCYAFAKARKTEINDPSFYQMLMAEEDGEVDEDLPPIDGHRIIAELGTCWSTVALMPRNVAGSNAERSDSYTITVYTITGGVYEFYISSLDYTLEWLLNQALQRRIEKEGTSLLTEYPTCKDCAMNDYVLETVENENCPLDLSLTIGATASMEFIILRKNSSRGEFRPHRPSSATDDADISFFSRSKNPSTDGSVRSSSRFDRISALSAIPKETIHLSPVAFEEDYQLGNVIAEYAVERTYRRLKSNWNARLLLRTNSIELLPSKIERKRSRFSISNERYSLVMLDQIGGIDMTEKQSGNRLLRILWLPLPMATVRMIQADTSKLFEWLQNDTLSNDDESIFPPESSLHSRRKLLEIYENASWKILRVEADAEDAWNIVSKLTELLDSRHRPIRRLFQFSNGGVRTPASAAEYMMNCAGESGIFDRDRRKSTASVTSRMSKWRSKVVSVVPSIQKVLSRNGSAT
ncbi:hypothetical protein AB6A40_001741 [Gnathostoma spinigerum]|uniref:Sin1 middle CRIM domain-containing protein n=1 Tax=Gnathostoma spinigerum TaxID=75299 RepID=A0ABD6EEA9_9BILA